MSEVAPGIFVHIGETALMTRENEGAIANVGFIIGESAVAVIDTGGSVREGERLLAAIRARTDKPIRYVINTHGHPDHVFGNAAFAGEGTRFVGHKNLPRALAARGQFYLDGVQTDMGDRVDRRGAHRAADAACRRRRSSSISVRAPSSCGHGRPRTATVISPILDEQTGTLFAGDLVFLEHIPGHGRQHQAAGSQVMDELGAPAPRERVVPGHGAVSDVARGARR